MKDYTELDAAILSQLSRRSQPMSELWSAVDSVAQRCDGRRDGGYRATDRRLQALRKAGKINYAGGRWHLTDDGRVSVAQEGSAGSGPLSAILAAATKRALRRDEVEQLRALQQHARDQAGLLDEVSAHFTRNDDLPGDLLTRIDAASAAAKQFS